MLKILKWRIIYLKKFVLKIARVIITITLNLIKFEVFGFDNKSLDEKECENILIYNFSYKTLIGTKPLCIRFDKIWLYLVLIKMMPFTIGLDTLQAKKKRYHICFSSQLRENQSWFLWFFANRKKLTLHNEIWRDKSRKRKILWYKMNK